MCRIHKIQGVKVVTKSNEWAKKKNGFGWMTVSSIQYHCQPEYSTSITSSTSNLESEGRSLASNNDKGDSLLFENDNMGKQNERESTRLADQNT